ncbi:MAG: hypothetical protein FJX29_07515 [Alphaproteobacteria bacterium]|nr:hypothetical protein [Alphaproteobacteria bacterium]
MGAIIEWPVTGKDSLKNHGNRAGSRLPVPEGGASILFFTGVRYERQAQTSVDDNPQSGRQGGGPSASRGGRPPRRSAKQRA